MIMSPTENVEASLSLNNDLTKLTVQLLTLSQVPSDDIVPTIRIHSRECVQENHVRYHHFNNFVGEEYFETENENEGLRLRKGDKSDENVTESETTKPKIKDPIKWFGVLSPPSLRQSQTCFKSVIELTIDCANIQSEILGVINRIKYLRRLMSRSQNNDIPEVDIENLDSKFAESVNV